MASKRKKNLHVEDSEGSGPSGKMKIVESENEKNTFDLMHFLIQRNMFKYCFNVFAHLDSGSFSNCRLVCKNWKKFIDEEFYGTIKGKEWLRQSLKANFFNYSYIPCRKEVGVFESSPRPRLSWTLVKDMDWTMVGDHSGIVVRGYRKLFAYDLSLSLQWDRILDFEPRFNGFDEPYHFDNQLRLSETLIICGGIVSDRFEIRLLDRKNGEILHHFERAKSFEVFESMLFFVSRCDQELRIYDISKMPPERVKCKLDGQLRVNDLRDDVGWNIYVDKTLDVTYFVYVKHGKVKAWDVTEEKTKYEVKVFDSGEKLFNSSRHSEASDSDSSDDEFDDEYDEYYGKLRVSEVKIKWPKVAIVYRYRRGSGGEDSKLFLIDMIDGTKCTISPGEDLVIRDVKFLDGTLIHVLNNVVVRFHTALFWDLNELTGERSINLVEHWSRPVPKTIDERIEIRSEDDRKLTQRPLKLTRDNVHEFFSARPKEKHSCLMIGANMFTLERDYVLVKKPNQGLDDFDKLDTHERLERMLKFGLPEVEKLADTHQILLVKRNFWVPNLN